MTGALAARCTQVQDGTAETAIKFASTPLPQARQRVVT